MKQYLTIAETAERLSVSRRAIETRIFRGEFPYRKLGKRVLIPVEELEQFLASLPGATADEALDTVRQRHR